MDFISSYAPTHHTNPNVPLLSPTKSDNEDNNRSNQNTDTGSQLPQATLAVTVEQTIRNTRARLEQHLAGNETNTDETIRLAADVVNIPCPLGMKYTKLDFPDLLKTNSVKRGQESLPLLAGALGILAKYGRNLLRENKPAVWRCVRFSNAVFNQKVDVIEGARDILKILGYTKHIEDGLAFPDEVEAPNIEEVTKLTADLIIAKHEVECLRSNNHPNPESVKQYMGSQVKSAHQMLRRLPSGTVPPVSGGIALPGMVPSVAKIARPPPSPPPIKTPPSQDKVPPSQQDKRPANTGGYVNHQLTAPSPVGIVSTGLTTDGINSTSPDSSTGSDVPYLRRPEDFFSTQPPVNSSVSLARPSSFLQSTAAQARYGSVPSPVTPKPPPTTRSTPEPKSPLQKEIDEERKCDLCGEEVATKACDICGDKRCDECDDRWHKHSARKDHTRRQLPPPTPSSPMTPIYENAERKDKSSEDTSHQKVHKSQSENSLSATKRPVPAPRQKRNTSLQDGSSVSAAMSTLQSQTLPRNLNHEPVDFRTYTLPKKPAPPPRPGRPLSGDLQYSGQYPASSSVTSPSNGPPAYTVMSPRALDDGRPYPLAYPHPYPGKVLSPEEEKRLRLTQELRNIDIEMIRREIEDICVKMSEMCRGNPSAKQTPAYQEHDQTMKYKMKGLEALMQELEDINVQLANNQSDARQMNYSLPPTITRPPGDMWSSGQQAPFAKGMGTSLYYTPNRQGAEDLQANPPASKDSRPFSTYDVRTSGPPVRIGAPPPAYSQVPPPQRGYNAGQPRPGIASPYENMPAPVPGGNFFRCEDCGHNNVPGSERCAYCFQRNLVPTDKFNFPPSHLPPAYEDLRADRSKAVERKEATTLAQSSPPAVSPKPGQSWACEHCTFLNTDPSTRICVMCDKTSLSIPLKKKPEVKPKPQHVLENRKSFTLKADSASTGHLVTESKRPAPADNVPTTFVHMQEEQEQVLMEKMQAKKEYEEQLQREREEEKRLAELGATVKRPDPVNLASETVSKPVIPKPVIPDKPEKAVPKPKKLDLSKWEEQKLDNLDKDRDQLKKDWQQQDRVAQNLRERKLLEEQRSDGLKFVTLLREAESQNFDSDELEIAMHWSENGNPLQWLQQQWPGVTETVAAMVTNYKENGSTVGNLGEASLHEAKEALKLHRGDVKKAVEECVNQRKKKIEEILDSGDFTRQEVGDALKRNKGSAEKAIVDLQRHLLQPFTERLWQPNDENVGIQQTDVNDQNADAERRTRLVLAEYRMPSWGRAETAIRLIDMAKYEVDDAIVAAKECGTLRRAVEFLEKECEVCYTATPMNKLVTLMHCQCRMCKECLVDYFRIQIRERNIRQCVCPVCSLPDMEDEENAEDYFQFLDSVVQYYLDEETHTLFQQKLRDMYLMKDPNFRWCSHCDFGFLNGNPDRLRMQCPECGRLTCFACKKHWLDQHEGISCEEFQAWKEANDPDRQAAGLAAHLKENGIDCPNCKFRYALAKGGCMHFKCSQCRHEFCSGCNKPFKTKCTQFKNCEKIGLHAHHPRNCLFYLRDEEINVLQKLLKDHDIAFDTAPPQPGARVAAEGEEEGAAAALPPPGKCRVEEQKETQDGLKDDFCGRDTVPGYAGLCKLHYSEYLVELIKNNNIDPAVMFKANQLQIILERNEIKVPQRKGKESEAQFTHRLLELVQQRIPLQEPR